MNDQVSNIRQVLAQTHAVERKQESARRKGEIQQQQVARHLVDRVDIHDHQVEEAPEAREKKVDPEGRGPEEESKGEPEPETPEEDSEPRPSAKAVDPLAEEESKGRVIDKKA